MRCGIRASTKSSLSIGFLHPSCLSGGGGERVLWIAVRAVRKAYPDALVVVYSAWSAHELSPGTACQRTQSILIKQFGFDCAEDLRFHSVNIVQPGLVDPSRYPRLTLLMQAVGALRIGLQIYCSIRLTF